MSWSTTSGITKCCSSNICLELKGWMMSTNTRHVTSIITSFRDCRSPHSRRGSDQSVNGQENPGRVSNPRTVERVAEARLPTEFGEFRIIGYRSLNSNEEFVVLAQ